MKKNNLFALLSLPVKALALALSFLVNPDIAASAVAVHYGEVANIGQGNIRSYLAVDSSGVPVELGLLMNRNALEGLPREKNTTGRCFDVNGNGNIDPADECEGDYELVVGLPASAAQRADIPFQWIGVNWNPGGHPPPGVYDLPHIDFHFYIASEESVRAIAPGTCGFFMDCDDFERATKIVPAKYVHKDHINVGAAVAAMGNHLVDPTSPELAQPPEKFTHTWIFGAFDGRITFYEPMITVDFLKARRNLCAPIKQPQAWEKSGYYPTQYCIRYHERADKHTVSLEGFRYRVAE